MDVIPQNSVSCDQKITFTLSGMGSTKPLKISTAKLLITSICFVEVTRNTFVGLTYQKSVIKVEIRQVLWPRQHRDVWQNSLSCWKKCDWNQVSVYQKNTIYTVIYPKTFSILCNQMISFFLSLYNFFVTLFRENTLHNIFSGKALFVADKSNLHIEITN